MSAGGILCYSKDFFESIIQDQDLVGGFLTGISDFTKEVTGDEIKSIKLKNYRFIYSISSQLNYIFVIVVEINDQEAAARSKLELMQHEFIKRYENILRNWNGDAKLFDGFDEFTNEFMYLPLKVLITGEEEVGKNTLLDLLDGEAVLELDDDLNESIMKEVSMTTHPGIKQCNFRIKDMNQLKNNPTTYKSLLRTTDLIMIVSNSAASNLSRVRDFIHFLKTRIRTPHLYIIANFQDLDQFAFEPEKIEESLGIKTYGFSAIQPGSKAKFNEILNEILEGIISEKNSSFRNNVS